MFYLITMYSKCLSKCFHRTIWTYYQLVLKYQNYQLPMPADIDPKLLYKTFINCVGCLPEKKLYGY